MLKVIEAIYLIFCLDITYTDEVNIMKKILLVEDNKTIREEIALILNLENYEVLEADDGMQGLEIARNQNPDLIISDLMMPRLDGFEFLKELRKDIKTSGIPFIFLSANVAKESLLKAKSLGSCEYLKKPFVSDDLLYKLQSYL